jgi:predicted methyltransferase
MRTPLNFLTPSLAMALLIVAGVYAPRIAPAEDEAPKRRPAEVISYRGWQWLERSTRAGEELPDDIVAAMELMPGQTVADIGSGSGYFTRRLARAVGPEGIVYGVDIQPEMLEIMQRLAEREGIDNITPVLGETADPKLPENSVDWILLVDTYHEFQEPEAMLAAMHRCLKDDGRVALIEYRLEGDSAAHIKRDHRMSVRQVLAEWNPAGYELVDLMEFLPSQHFFVFRKRP